MESNNLNDTILGKRTFEQTIGEDLLNKSLEKEEENHENQDNDNESEPEADDVKLSKEEIDPLRLCILGLDTYSKEKDLVKFCQKEFNPPIEISGVNKKKGKGHAFLAFKSVEDKERFENELGNKKLKNRKVKCRPVKIDHQSLKYEKKIKTGQETFLSQRPKQASQKDIDEEMSKPIQEKVCPLWQTPYEEQLKMKFTAMENVLKKISVNAYKTLKHEDQNLPFVPMWLSDRPEGPCCDLSQFVGADSDKAFYYRNKAEFTIGESYQDNGQIKVGFNHGNFSKGFMFVESAEDCPIMSKESLALASLLEKYIRDCGIPAYKRGDHTGFWRNLIVRQSVKTKELLISVVAAKEKITPEQYEKVKQELSDLFLKEFNMNGYKIVSILLQDHSSVSDSVPHDAPYEIIYGGQDYYMDEIMGFKFRVNVSAFLQVNCPQTEKLYSLVQKLADVDENTVFLDICCGIGTIGICAASKAHKIVGVEMVERAIRDAEFNMQLNGLNNGEFHVGKVESMIAEVIKPYLGSKIIGVVDPPRAGLHKDVIKALRTCKGLDKLIYVSCNPEGSMVDNVLGLCLPETKKRRAPPFTITEAYGVDLFPQTHHFEGVLLLERLYNRKGERKEQKTDV